MLRWSKEIPDLNFPFGNVELHFKLEFDAFVVVCGFVVEPVGLGGLVVADWVEVFIVVFAFVEDKVVLDALLVDSVVIELGFLHW